MGKWNGMRRKKKKKKKKGREEEGGEGGEEEARGGYQSCILQIQLNQSNHAQRCSCENQQR